MALGIPAHSLVEPVCWASQQLRAMQRAQGGHRYMGTWWLRTPLLKVKAICAWEPGEVVEN